MENEAVKIITLCGNDKNLALWVYETVVENGQAVRRAFDFSSCDSVETSFIPKQGGKYAIAHSAIDGEVNGLLLTIPYTLPAGKYGVEVKAVLNGTHLRSFERGIVNIVYSNAEAKDATFARVSSVHNCDYEIDMQIVPSATLRPLNMYEMWKQVPGNADKTFNDFMQLYLIALTDEAVQLQLSGKVDKVDGKGLSTFDFDQYWRGTISSLMSAVQQLDTAIRGNTNDINGEIYY